MGGRHANSKTADTPPPSPAGGSLDQPRRPEGWPPNVRRALAATPPPNGRLSDIKQVVLLMQENRNFDHYFGT